MPIASRPLQVWRRRPSWLVAVALLVCGVYPAFAPSAIAAPANDRPVEQRIAIQAPLESEITARLVAELRFLGFSAEVTAPSEAEPLDPASLETVAAAITVDAQGERVEITIVDRITGKRVSRTLTFDDPQSIDPREVAVRAVELLRASLLELEHAEPPPEADVKLSAPARRTLRRRDFRVGLGAGVGVGGGPGGVPVATHARVHVRYTPHPRIGVVLVGNVPLHAPQVRAAEGTARIRAGWFGVGPRLALRRPDAILVPDLSVTAGATIVDMQGVPAPGYQAASTRVVDAIFEGAAGVEVAVSARVRVRLDAAAAVCARTIRVRFAARSAAQWCRPHVLGSLGVGVLVW